jgi:hypothetical protein
VEAWSSEPAVAGGVRAERGGAEEEPGSKPAMAAAAAVERGSGRAGCERGRGCGMRARARPCVMGAGCETRRVFF